MGKTRDIGRVPRGFMRKKEKMASKSVALLALIIATSSAKRQHKEEGGLDFYDLKCSACCSIVAELERNLETEKPRSNPTSHFHTIFPYLFPITISTEHTIYFLTDLFILHVHINTFNFYGSSSIYFSFFFLFFL